MFNKINPSSYKFHSNRRITVQPNQKPPQMKYSEQFDTQTKKLLTGHFTLQNQQDKEKNFKELTHEIISKFKNLDPELYSMPVTVNKHLNTLLNYGSKEKSLNKQQLSQFLKEFVQYVERRQQGYDFQTGRQIQKNSEILKYLRQSI